MAEDLNLSNLSPAQPRRERKRIGRGLGSGKGRYSGRGLKGQKARSGSAKMRAGFEGGQMPLYMRLPKQRGSTSKDAMPIGPFRTKTIGVNVRVLEERFEDGAEVTPDALVAAGVLKNTRTDLKILGVGDLTKGLTVVAHGFSASARAKIEEAGGTVVSLREPRGGTSPERSAQAEERQPAPAASEHDEAVEDEEPAGAAEAPEGEG